MASIQPSPLLDTYADTISNELDRLEIPAGKIGLITADQAFALLSGLDDVYARIQKLDKDNSSRKIAEAQFAAIEAKLHAEARRFIRDLGGAQALSQKREMVKPPENYGWWYLDIWLAAKRRATLRRILTGAGIAVVALLVLALLYQKFLAPDPKDTAQYGHEQTARDLMMSNDLKGALQEVNQGLAISTGSAMPKSGITENGTLLVLKGVIQEGMGQTDQAKQSFTAAEPGFQKRTDFLLSRAEDYLIINLLDQSMADAKEALRLDPNSAQAYLTLGQIYEVQKNYKSALDQYNQAYDVADKMKQSELAALSRMRIAMLMQSMDAQMPPEFSITPTPTP